MLLVIFDQKVVDHKQDVVYVVLQALVVQQTTTLCVVVWLKVIVQHVVAVQCVFGLFAEADNTLVDLAGGSILGSRVASHQSGQGDKALWAVLLD